MIKKKNNALKSKEDNFDYMKTNKDNIGNILRDQNYIKKKKSNS